MISLASVLSSKPVLITRNIKFYQPTLQEIVDMGEDLYWSSLNLWTLKRKDLVPQEAEETRDVDDFEIWKMYMFSSLEAKRALATSIQIFLKTKVEFFDITGTIYIGEDKSGVLLDNTFYLLMKELCTRITPNSSASEKGEQFKETENMTERERQLIAKMRASEKKIEEAKNPNRKPEDFLGSRILGLVAVGGYTFEQVYNMTMLQFNLLLQKYVDIQTFELRTILSPYASSENNQNENSFWLD